MSATKPSLSSRFLRFLGARIEPGTKCKTIKKVAPVVPTDTAAQEGPILKPTDDGKFPREYYTPRPVPKTFVVGEVRKVSNCGSPPDSIENRQKVAETAAAKQTEGTVEANPTGRTSDHAVNCTASYQRRSLKGSTSASSIILKSPANIDTLPHRLNGKRRQRLTFDLLLGQQDPTSSYFTRRFFSESSVGDGSDAFESPKDILHHISELDPQAFDMYKIYTHTGKIAFKSFGKIEIDHVWISSWPLMNAHILGCVIEEHGFTDRAMDIMTDKLTLAGAPDLQTVRHLFDPDRKSIPGVLKAFVVDRFINAQQRSCDILKTTSYPASFKELVLQSTLRHMSYNRSTTTSTECEYHTHGSREACYKTRLTPADKSKERKLVAARKTSARDANLVTAKALQNGVKIIDWEQCRENAHQALRIETGQIRPSLWKLAEAEPVYPVESSELRSCKIHGSTAGKQDRGQSLDVHRTPHNSPMLQAQSAELGANDSAVPFSHLNSDALASQSTFRQIRPPVQGSHGFFLAELEDSSVASRPTELALKYKPSVDRIRTPDGQIMPTLVVTNGAGETSSDSAAPSDLEAEALATEYDKYVQCPGTYPESNSGA